MAERDVGVWVCGNLKNSWQRESFEKPAINLIGILRRIFGTFTLATMFMVLNTSILLLLECASHAWTHWQKEDKLLLSNEIGQRFSQLLTRRTNGVSELPNATT